MTSKMSFKKKIIPNIYFKKNHTQVVETDLRAR